MKGQQSDRPNGRNVAVGLAGQSTQQKSLSFAKDGEGPNLDETTPRGDAWEVQNFQKEAQRCVLYVVSGSRVVLGFLSLEPG